MRTITVIPHEVEIPYSVLHSLDACSDSELLTPTIAIGRVDKSNWIALVDTGEAMMFIASDAKPTVAQIMSHARTAGARVH